MDIKQRSALVRQLRLEGKQSYPDYHTEGELDRVYGPSRASVRKRARTAHREANNVWADQTVERLSPSYRLSANERRDLTTAEGMLARRYQSTVLPNRRKREHTTPRRRLRRQG